VVSATLVAPRHMDAMHSRPDKSWSASVRKRSRRRCTCMSYANSGITLTGGVQAAREASAQGTQNVKKPDKAKAARCTLLANEPSGITSDVALRRASRGTRTLSNHSAPLSTPLHPICEGRDTIYWWMSATGLDRNRGGVGCSPSMDCLSLLQQSKTLLVAA
jgi:hypothetical protein